MNRLAIALLSKEEGVRLEPYKDKLGYWTVGVGHLIDRRKGGKLPPWVTPSSPLDAGEVQQMLVGDVGDVETQLLSILSWYAALDPVRQAVLLSMAYQMGVRGLMKFYHMLHAVQDGRYADAAVAMLQSEWARQTPERAQRHARAMETGAAADLGV